MSQDLYEFVLQTLQRKSLHKIYLRDSGRSRLPGSDRTRRLRKKRYDKVGRWIAKRWNDRNREFHKSIRKQVLGYSNFSLDRFGDAIRSFNEEVERATTCIERYSETMRRAIASAQKQTREQQPWHRNRRNSLPPWRRQ